ncbi:hypothetical protein M404DRAFT_611050 [Pisolithus tinctorius Marx 270]|uniref:Uncharacterized protein n=1 Tax=Pisolithus tinctorius Marx 270 TaxID=870435 RepID=A0A0C3NRW7_PISTI|nr:hypothetical protein M404DRAFT_611050 [Pisolithus tinctorius Marx 270]
MACERCLSSKQHGSAYCFQLLVPHFTTLSMASGWFSRLCDLRPHSRVPRSKAVVPRVSIEVTQTSSANLHVPVLAEIATPALAEVTHRGSTPTGILAPALSDVSILSRSTQDTVENLVSGLTDSVCMKTISPKANYSLDLTLSKGHIDRIHRFRILVMGRANAGKTTILQRICNTTDQPEVFNGDGKKVDATMVQGSLARGYHSIEDELIFKSSPRFVFHDSCGFEAGSEAQFGVVKEFVMDRANTAKLDKRIHAIWMVLAAERKFFDECETGHVPVIALLTKADTLELEAMQEIEELDVGMDKARIAEIQSRMLDESLSKAKDWLSGLRFPPCDFLPLTGMQKEGANCMALLKCTADCLSEGALQKLLISTQQTNLAMCIEFAVKK